MLPPNDIFDKKSPETKNFNTEKLREKIQPYKMQEFSRYLTKVFERTMKTPDIANQILDLGSASIEVKVAFTQHFTDIMIDLINKDINVDNVTIYKNDGSVLEISDENKFFRELYKQDIKIPKITVQNVEKNGFNMGVCSTRKLHINFGFPIYKATDCFLMDLRHEFGHIVDIFSPQISPLCTEVINKSNINYVSPEENYNYYQNNILEENANICRSEYANKIRQTLKEITDSNILINSSVIHNFDHDI